MATFKIRNIDLLLVGVLTSLLLTLISFWTIAEIFNTELLITLGFVVVAVLILYSYVNKRSYLSNLLLVFHSFNLMNIIYIYLYKFSWWLVPNFAISFCSFAYLVFLSEPLFHKKKHYSRSKSEMIAKEIRDSVSKVKNKIIVEDLKTGKKSDLESEIKRKSVKKKSQTKSKKTPKKKTKKTSSKKKTSKKAKSSSQRKKKK